jgi:predicted nuclease with TOPRIM domain
MADDLLFDYMFLKNEDKKDQIEELKEENNFLKEQLDKKNNKISDNEDTFDKIRFFAEDVQSIASDC